MAQIEHAIVIIMMSYGIVDILFLISMGRRLVVVGLIFLK